MQVNRVHPATAQALAQAAEVLRYQNKQMEVHRQEELLKQERQRLSRLKPTDPDKGQNVDVTV